MVSCDVQSCCPHPGSPASIPSRHPSGQGKSHLLFSVNNYWHLKGASGILAPIRRIPPRIRRSRSVITMMRSPRTLRHRPGPSRTSHRSSIPILIINGLLTNSCSIRRIRCSEICGRLMGGQSIWLFGSGELGIPILGLALPELAAGRAGCVTVVRGGTKGFLSLVVADESQLDED